MLADEIQNVLFGIDDPEMPISIVDLGIVDRVTVIDDAVHIRILPTFVGCPALDMLRDEITRKTAALPGVASVRVEFTFDPPWTPDRISQAGRDELKRFGVTVPRPGERAATLVQVGIPQAVSCPFCGADKTEIQNTFGPTRCRMIYYCAACKNQFEHMKAAAPDFAAPVDL